MINAMLSHYNETSVPSAVKLFRGLLLELPIDVALLSARSLEPKPSRGEVTPGGEGPESSFLLRDSLHRRFFSLMLSAASAVEMLTGSSSWSMSEPSLKEE
ncbi:hypothetical protein HYQ46_009850 [Verticillium longisporum]|nr:hypothetical protein HYQ46_009850 [Verticillium longisporum]